VPSEPSEIELLTDENYKAFAERQCLKIGYYLQKIRKIDLLQMSTEFLVDENGNMWLSSIDDIHVLKSGDGALSTQLRHAQ
jgi:hypothetical protein